MALTDIDMPISAEGRRLVYAEVSRIAGRPLSGQEHRGLKALLAGPSGTNRQTVSPKASRIARRRAVLMAECPYCHWCGRELSMPDRDGSGGKIPDDFPTIDHLNSRFKGERPDLGNREEMWVLACPECNNMRSKSELRTSSWRQRWKSGAFPFPFRWIGGIARYVKKTGRA